MKKIKVNVRQISSRTIEILAEDKASAIKITEELYQNDDLFLFEDDIISKEITIEKEENVNPEYLKRISQIDKNLLVCEVKDNQFFMFDDVEYSVSTIGLLKREKDTIWITNIFYTNDCPNEDDNILFYFKALRGYSVMNFFKYKTKTVKELFMIEKDLYSSYTTFGYSIDKEFFVIQTDIPFQELNSFILHKIHYENE